MKSARFSSPTVKLTGTAALLIEAWRDVSSFSRSLRSVIRQSAACAPLSISSPSVESHACRPTTLPTRPRMRNHNKEKMKRTPQFSRPLRLLTSRPLPTRRTSARHPQHPWITRGWRLTEPARSAGAGAQGTRCCSRWSCRTCWWRRASCSPCTSTAASTGTPRCR